MVLGGRRNLLINKDCYSDNETTNQAVGGSTPSGRANSNKISKIEEIAGIFFPYCCPALYYLYSFEINKLSSR